MAANETANEDWVREAVDRVTALRSLTDLEGVRCFTVASIDSDAASEPLAATGVGKCLREWVEKVGRSGSLVRIFTDMSPTPD